MCIRMYVWVCAYICKSVVQVTWVQVQYIHQWLGEKSTTSASCRGWHHHMCKCTSGSWYIQETTNSPLRMNGLVSRSQVKAAWLCETTNGLQPPTICRMLQEEGLIANRMGIHKFLQKHRETNNIERRPGSGSPTKMTAAVKVLVQQTVVTPWD